MLHRSIACVLNGDEKFGVVGPALTLLGGLKSRGWDCRAILLQQGAVVESCQQARVETTVLDERTLPFVPRNVGQVYESLFLRPRRERQIATRIAEVLRSEGLCKVLVRWPNHLAFSARAAKIADAQCCWMMPNEVGNGWWGLNRRYYQSIIRRQGVVTLPNSVYTANSLSSELASQTLYLGIDDSRFDPASVTPYTRDDLGIDPDATVFGIHARICDSKGQELFAQSLQAAGSPEDKIHLLLVGDGDEAVIERIRSSVQGRGNRRVYFTGWTQEPEAYYGVVDVAVNSRIDAEPFGLSVIEAMAMKKPVLLHALGGPAETVIDGATGWHVNEPTAAAFQAGINRAIADRSKWAEMGEEARRRVAACYSQAAFVDNFLTLTGKAS